ncbi:alcohol-forming fatty acyl-CoA reductase-like [Humulus lupulus]|uniref:alcohol-forming fatty acyl-CoA reductase-like n=1 Tax=Humulus lupulus TaxID=3486 RepID=UPI002B412BC6|nr:alcohol-forming fatty acyl-CoA reductase-like [Humulus lupulus]
METQRSMRFLENKTVLVTGASGFLAKLFVEKILRVWPNVKRVYLLLRASDSNSATQRMHTQVIGKEVFRVLKEEQGKDFDGFIEQKLVAVAGDISYEDLKIEDVNLRHEMWDNLDIILNSAATTDFYERYDVALSINTMGAVHMLNFAKKCRKLVTVLHVSTAYVCGEVEGVIEEKAFEIGETLKKSNKLDFEVEKQLVQQKLNQLQQLQASQQVITTTMKEFGIQRAKLFGWPNTYVFTKAMGEMCLEQSKDDLSIIIIRPTMITSTYKEPFPGWIEGLRTVDSVIMGYGKGKIRCFLGSPKLILDLIPGDMVVNAIIMAIGAQEKKASTIIYQVGSSMRNPINISQIYNFSFRYFTNHPLINKDDKKPIKVGNLALFKTFTTFQIYIAIRFIFPLKIWQLKNKLFSYGDSKEKCAQYMKKLKGVLHLVQLYKPYVLFNSIFDDINLERLRQNAKESEDIEAFNCDPKCIVWEDYLINTHIPGLLKYVCK